MPDTLRIDKWLFFTRFFKTRGQATSAVTGGHVERNGERAKPATPLPWAGAACSARRLMRSLHHKASMSLIS